MNFMAETDILLFCLKTDTETLTFLQFMSLRRTLEEYTDGKLQVVHQNPSLAVSLNTDIIMKTSMPIEEL